MDINAILTWLVVAWNWSIEHWQVAVTLFPILGTVFVSLTGKIGRAGAIFWSLAAALKDHVLSDTEAASFVWMLASVAFGPWYNVSTRVLDFAPDHQIAMLKTKKFIPDTYRPSVLPANGV